MTQINRYRADPRRIEGKISLTDILVDMQQRLKTADSALRIGNTAIEDGELLVRNGDIVVGETDGTEVLRIYHGIYPRIHFTPMGADAEWVGILFSQEQDDHVALEMGVYHSDDPFFPAEGGKIMLNNGSMIVSFHPAYSGGEEIYMWFHPYGDFPGYEEVIAFRGQFPESEVYDTHQAVITGRLSLGSGFTGMVWSYGATMATNMAPVATPVDTSGLITSWNFTTANTSGWQLDWTGTTAKVVNWWASRMSS